jgi:hypothetical protein
MLCNVHSYAISSMLLITLVHYATLLTSLLTMSYMFTILAFLILVFFCVVPPPFLCRIAICLCISLYIIMSSRKYYLPVTFFM